MNISITDNWAQWLEKIPAARRDIYFTEQYVKLYENEQDTALCIVVEDGNFCLLMPFLRREIEGGYFDFETPYGYGGFISNDCDKAKNDEAISLAIKFFAHNGYVAGFVRFHPLLGNADMCRRQTTVIDDRPTIAMDLRPAVDDIWMNQVHAKNRNVIKKAKKRELEFVADHQFVYMADFVRLYNATMDKLGADGFYYFDQKYYDLWLETLRDKSFLSVVKYEGRVISACIIMYAAPYGHYHLSGSDRHYLNLDPNNFMLWNAALELKKMGIEQFHLGGGIDSNPENSLYKFKSRLSTNNYQFSFGKLIFNDEIYRKLCKQWEVKNPDKVELYGHHLLKYRLLMDSRVYIIAEAGVNHNGRLDLALQLCDAAKEAGVDAVKFQTWKTENIVTKETEQAQYQTVNTEIKESQFDMLKRLELPYADFVTIKKHCDQIGIQFLSTPDEVESLEFLCTLDMPFIKIGSGEITNIPYLRLIGSKKMRVVISTGMSYIEDVRLAYHTLIEAGAPKVDVLHCTTNYPCPMDEVNLRAMQTIKADLGCTVGYSDHTLGIEVAVAAVALGAEIVEKHFTLDRSLEGPDHKASLNPAQLREMVVEIRNIERALGDGVKRPNASEVKISEVVFKRIVAAKHIAEGEQLTADNITVKRAASGIAATQWDAVIGQAATKSYLTDQPIEQ